MSTQPTQLSFFQSVSKFAKPYVKGAAVAADPLTQARTRFVAAADESIQAINEGKDKSCPRRSNFDPPCRLNFDPGLGAGFA
ncbi:MAG: hypothetical protein IT499_02160 [Rubrivivax sp.]|nr:hypothetical protein [Rubrivivax sp.]